MESHTHTTPSPWIRTESRPLVSRGSAQFQSDLPVFDGIESYFPADPQKSDCHKAGDGGDQASPGVRMTLPET